LEKNVASYKWQIKDLEFKFDNFSGKEVNIDEWGKIGHVKVDGIRDLSTIFYSDGSTKEDRNHSKSLKNALRVAEIELEKYPSRPSWKDYDLSNRPAAEAITRLLLKSYYKLEDLITFESVQGSGSHSGRKAVIIDTENQEDREECRKIANRYIKDCEKKSLTPIIADAVIKIKEESMKSRYKKETIHNWIKDLFPEESRKPGRKPGWQERKAKNK